MSEIAKLAAHQVEAAAATLARAFDDDPLTMHLFPHPRTRRACLHAFHRAVCRDALPFGHTYAATDGDRVLGVAAWLPSEAHPPSRRRQLRELATMAGIGLRSPRVVSDGLRMIVATQRVHPRHPHWYLAVLGVEPSEQGRGHGRRLIGPALAEADTTGLPAWLETTKERNLAWYSGVGFGQLEELRPFGSGPPIWTMERAPRS